MSETPIYDEIVESRQMYSHRSPAKFHQRIIFNLIPIMLVSATILFTYSIAKVLFFLW